MSRLIYCLIWTLLNGFTFPIKKTKDSILFSPEKLSAEARLLKVDPQYIICTPCDETIIFNQNQNVPNFREYGLYLQSGYYLLYLTGPKGTVLTLFGAESFDPLGGYLIIKKTDNRSISIENLESFETSKWYNVKPTKGEGGYKLYYRHVYRFKQNIASLRWDLWWKIPPNTNTKIPN